MASLPLPIHRVRSRRDKRRESQRRIAMMMSLVALVVAIAWLSQAQWPV